MLFERVEAAAPELAIGGKPPIHLGEGLGPEAVQPPLALWPHRSPSRRRSRIRRRCGSARTSKVESIAPKNSIPGGLGALCCEMETESAHPLESCGTIRPMRRSAALTAAVIASLTTAAGAQAAQSISADPVKVGQNATQTVRGRDWPVIEFCSRTVRVSVRSAQNSVPIAQRHVSDSGRFSFRWVPKNKNIGPGRWRLVARMRCESGKDGSTVFTRASRLIRVRP